MTLSMTPEDLLAIILEAGKSEPPVTFGTIATVITGDADVILGATVTFDGEETTSAVDAVTYVPLSRYVPVVGDRVMLLRAGHTAVIVDKVGHV